MPPVRQSSLRSVVLGVLALAALAYLLLPALFPPQADEMTEKIAALELQIQQLKASYNSAAPRDSIVNIRQQLNALQYQISRHEAALEASRQSEAEAGEVDPEVVISAAQREISALREEVLRLQKAYEELERQNALEHKSLLDEHQELEEQNAIQHMQHQHEHQKQQEQQPQQPQGNDQRQPNSYPALGSDTVLLIICHNRADYLSRTLEGIAKHHPKQNIPILISQDGNEPSVVATIEHFKARFEQVAKQVPVVHLQHTKHVRRGLDGYFYLAEHYKFALDTIFNGDAKLPENHLPVQRVIILEEDLDISPDFFEYFAAVAPMLDNDRSLLAASAWNDNGMKGFVKDNTALYRSDFFPGLGWMLVRRVWEELSPKWPAAYWDDWLREPSQRQGRQVIRPEVCRTYHFGVKGTSNAQYSKFLTDIELNTEFVPFTRMDLSYLEQPNWDDTYLKDVQDAQLAAINQYKSSCEKYKRVRLQYTDLADFERLARQLGVMDNVKAGVPRAAYQGVVSFWKGDCKIHLAPSDL